MMDKERLKQRIAGAVVACGTPAPLAAVINRSIAAVLDDEVRAAAKTVKKLVQHGPPRSVGEALGLAADFLDELAGDDDPTPASPDEPQVIDVEPVRVEER